jgi:alpha-methylacyl-CoA racemase
VLTLEEALHHPHNVARGTFVDVAGAPLPGPAPRFSRTPGVTGPVGEIGAATRELLAEAGYGDTELAELRAAGAIE